MYLVKNIGRVFSYAKRILRKTVLVKPMGDSPSRIDEELRYDFLLFAPFGARMLTFIPKWAKYFDSHNCPVLPDANWRYVPPEKVPKSFRKLEKRKKRASRSSKCIHKFILLRSLFPRISLLLAGIFKAKKLISQIGFSLLFCCVGDFCCFCWPGPCRGSAAFFSCLPIGHSARGSQAPLAPWPGDGPQA